MSAMTAQLGLRFDLRVPPFAETTHADQYRAMLEMVSWGEAHGFSSVGLSEHHGDPAGYLPSPLTVAAAVLGRTTRLNVRVSAVLLPLHDPVRLAEQLATVDCLGPGRLTVVLGAGYRKVEFEMAGVERSARGRLMEEYVEVLRNAWTGRPFRFRGREVLVTPAPATPGGPTILLGASSLAAARRAARLRTDLMPAEYTPAIMEAYYEECERVGFPEGSILSVGTKADYEAMRTSAGERATPPGFVMVSEDPEATWARIGRNAEYDASTYAAWQDEGLSSSWVVPDAASWRDLRDSGRYAVVTPDECLRLAERDGSLKLHPLMGGIAPELAWESLELFEKSVLPQLTVDRPAPTGP